MNILTAVDMSQVGEAIVAMTARIAKGIGARVLLVSVAPREADILGRQLRRKVITDPVPEALRERRAILDRYAATLVDAGVSYETLLIRGDPARTLIREADRWSADLIIVGSHGRGALFRRLIGSVSEAVLRDSKIPVLVVPARTTTSRDGSSPRSDDQISGDS